MDVKKALSFAKTFRLDFLREVVAVYLAVDVKALTDVFENYRCNHYGTFGLDPAWFIGIPSLAYATCFKYTGARVERLPDIDMYLMVEKGIRGGLCQTYRESVVANDERFEAYEPSKPPCVLEYYDANNHYPCQLCDPMPHHGYRWSDEDFDPDGDYSSEGGIFEVDIEYPVRHSWALAPVSTMITKEMLSEETLARLELVKQRANKTMTFPQKRLLPHYGDRENYVVEAETLQYYCSKGLKVTKTHRSIRFAKTPWIAPFILHLAEERRVAKEAGDTARVAMLKLIGNSLGGKFGENPRGRKEILVVKSSADFVAAVASPLYVGITMVGDNIGFAEMEPHKALELGKLVPVSQAMLDKAKVHLYRLYDRFREKCGDKVEIVYTDTDSMILAFSMSKEEVQVAKREMQAEDPLFDDSNLPKDDPDYSTEFCARLGFLKNERPGRTILNLYAPQPKVYLLISIKDTDIAKGEECLHVWEEAGEKQDDGTMVRKCVLCGVASEHTHHAKGVPTRMARLLTESVFAAKEPKTQTFTQMRANAMRIQTFEASKMSVSFVDIKGYWIDGRSIPFFHDTSSPPAASNPPTAPNPPAASTATMHDLETATMHDWITGCINVASLDYELEDEIDFIDVDSDAD